jgi:very-short-patch-repair endonuclease/predicted transcriptional regulator of viral defense system
LAARQHGVVAFRQLKALGFTKYAVHRRVRAGRLRALYRGVYAVGHRALTTKGRWLAAVLACGPNAVLSHRAALALWELAPVPSGPIDVTVIRSGGRGQPGIRRHCVRSMRREDRTVLDAIPVTTVARALLDYAQTTNPQQLRAAVEAAERLQRLDGRAIQDLLARSPGRATARLRTAVAQITGPAPWTRSELERAFLALVREAGLPEPQANVIVAGHLVDFHWPAAKLVVEVDGYAFHRGRASFEADRHRDLDLQLAGQRAIRLTQRRIHTERSRIRAELRALITRTDLL